MKIGVIGAGRWGRNIIRACAQLGVLESICDANAPALAEMGREYPHAGLESEITALLARNIDAVVVAAPPAVHAELALAAIAAGKHVFVEKPLAMSVDDAAMVVRAARAREMTLFVGHVLLYHPGVQRMLGLIREGAIGEVRHLRSRRLSWGTLRANENVWWSFAPHDVALALEVFDEFPLTVAGATSAFVREHIADFAYADLTFTRRRTAHIETSWLDPDKSSRLDVFGATGVLRLIDSREGASLTLTPCGQDYDEFGHATLWREEERPVDFTPAEPLLAEVRAFVEAAASGQRPLTDGENGLRVVQVLSMFGVRNHRPSFEEIA
ncbi:MAG TPA: Gfo/Idh/MocA family oxidoreductase [Candidatus Baltobacteraceae bacterium]|nr:Gfo/Idh/MocA family oxidoreductase [Candidatus Baltobacteraceae bacterium]